MTTVLNVTVPSDRVSRFSHTTEWAQGVDSMRDRVHHIVRMLYLLNLSDTQGWVGKLSGNGYEGVECGNTHVERYTMLKRDFCWGFDVGCIRVGDREPRGIVGASL